MRTALVVGLALLAGPAAAWSQMGGDAAQSGVVDLPPVDLDVVRSYRLAPEDFAPHLDPGVLATPIGLVGLANGRDEPLTCRWVVVADPLQGGFEAGAEEPCPYDGLVVAYDASLELVYVCMDGKFDDPLFQARTLAGEIVWTASPDLPLGDPVATEDTDWFCNNASLDEQGDRVYIPWSTDLGGNRVTALDAATGERLWSRSVPASAVAGYRLGPLDANGYAFSIAWSTLTEGTLVLAGVVAPGVNADVVGQRASLSDDAFVWLDLDGEIVGSAAGSLRTDPRAGARSGESDPAQGTRRSATATASGPLAAFALGDRVLVVSPTTGRPVLAAPLPANEPLVGADNWPPPRWWERHVLVPLRHTLVAYDARDLSERWTWTESNEWSIMQLVVAPPRDAYVLAARTDRAVALFRVDLATGETLQRLPLPLEGAASLLGLRDGQGLLVRDDEGLAVALAPAPEARRPAVAVSSAYPGVGERVELRATGAGERFLVAWEPGFLSEAEPGEVLSHEYTQAGLVETRVTAVFRDGTTATRAVRVQVGGTPPLELTALQRAFAPGNQELTFFVLGLVATGAGAAFGLWRVRSNRRRLHDELQAVERAYAATRERPADAEAALAERKAHARGLLLGGKITEAQFAILERRVEELAGTLRRDALETRFDFLPVGMARTLRGMLADGRITTWEHRHFLEALDRDTLLTPAQKAKVRALLDEWFERDRER